MNPLKKISVILSFILITCCADSLDFNQIEDYKIKPVLTAALTFFSVQPFQFFNENGVQQNSREDVTEFKLFENEFISDNVVKMVFNAEFKNEFDRDVTIEISFLNENNREVYTFTKIAVESLDINPPAYEEEIDIILQPEILTASKVKIRASLEDIGVQMNPNEKTEFEFKSSITLFVESDF